LQNPREIVARCVECTESIRAADMITSPRSNNHTGSYEGVRSSIVRARWQIFGMLTVGGAIIGALVYLSLTK
jgi:hypothetical protein